MATVGELRKDLEQRLGVRLAKSEAAVKAAYGVVTGFTGDQLDQEFEVALGRQRSGTPVLVGGKLRDDPDVAFADALPAR